MGVTNLLTPTPAFAFYSFRRFPLHLKRLLNQPLRRGAAPCPVLKTRRQEPTTLPARLIPWVPYPAHPAESEQPGRSNRFAKTPVHSPPACPASRESQPVRRQRTAP